MFKVISPINKQNKFTVPAVACFINKPKHVIFLAGPCPRVNYNEDWRFEAIKYLEEAGFDGIIFNPTNPKYNTADPTYLEKQVKWEQNAMYKADKVLFWIPRSAEHPAFTTNIELGHFLEKDRANKFIIGMPDDAIKNDYIKVRLKMINKHYDTDLKTLVYHAVEELK